MSKKSKLPPSRRTAELLRLVNRLSVDLHPLEDEGISEPLKDCVTQDSYVLPPSILKDIPSAHSVYDPARVENSEMAYLERERNVRFVNNFVYPGKYYLSFILENLPDIMPLSFMPHRMRGITSKLKQNMRKFDFLLASRTSSHSQHQRHLIVGKNMDSHRGEGIKVQTPLQFLREGRDDGTKFYQTFCFPSDKISPDGHMRDCRVVLIKGDPVGYYVRRAKEPLIDARTGRLIEYPPSLDRVLTNVFQGGTVETNLDESVVNSLFEVSRDMHKVITIYSHVLDKFLGQPPREIRYGLLSVDFLFYSTGRPVVSEIDWAPDLSTYPNKQRLADIYLDHMTELAEGRREILFRTGPLIEELKTATRRKGIKYGVLLAQ